MVGIGKYYVQPEFVDDMPLSFYLLETLSPTYALVLVCEFLTLMNVSGCDDLEFHIFKVSDKSRVGVVVSVVECGTSRTDCPSCTIFTPCKNIG